MINATASPNPTAIVCIGLSLKFHSISSLIVLLNVLLSCCVYGKRRQIVKQEIRSVTGHLSLVNRGNEACCSCQCLLTIAR